MINPKLLRHTVMLAALMMISAAAAGNTPNPTTVTIVGNFQSELGCTDDWRPDCSATHLTYLAVDDVWQGVFIIPAGSWEYKLAVNNSWDENYGLNATRDGASIFLSLAEDAYVTFYYDHKTHWVTDDYNSIIATVPGNYLSGMGAPDWQPGCLRSWLQDPDGDGIYTFGTDLIEPGSYEARVAYYGNWGINYGVGGDEYGPNYEFSVFSEGTEVQFSYDPVTHILTISPGGAENLPPTAVAGDDQSVRPGQTVNLDGSGSLDDSTPSESLLYAWSFVSVPAGSAATLLDCDTSTPSFLADLAGAYVVSLTVTDEAGMASTPDEVVIGTANQAPTAVATANPVLVVLGNQALELRPMRMKQGALLKQHLRFFRGHLRVREGRCLANFDNTVHFDGSGSTDPEDDALTYVWTLTSAPAGSGAALVGAGTVAPTLTPDVEGVYEVSLEVSDELGPGAPVSITITAITASDYAESKAVDASNEITGLTSGEVSTKGNKTALKNFLNQAVAALQAGDVAGAIDKLQKAIERTDGCALRGTPDASGPGRDWVTDCAAQAGIYQLLLEALNALTA